MQILQNASNKIVVQEKEGVVLYSYKTKIATITNGGEVVEELDAYGNKWKDYSRTTKKHYNQFINEYK